MKTVTIFFQIAIDAVLCLRAISEITKLVYFKISLTNVFKLKKYEEITILFSHSDRPKCRLYLTNKCISVDRNRSKILNIFGNKEIKESNFL